MTVDPERVALVHALKRLIKAKGIAQKSIALEAKVHESTVSRWFDTENPTLPDSLELAAICRLAGINPAELFLPLMKEAGADPTVLRLWGLLIAMSPAQRGQLADFLEAMKGAATGKG